MADNKITEQDMDDQDLALDEYNAEVMVQNAAGAPPAWGEGSPGYTAPRDNGIKEETFTKSGLKTDVNLSAAFMRAHNNVTEPAGPSLDRAATVSTSKPDDPGMM